ncbi:MAG: alpha/beta hydrolase [Elusimicrobiaceae bacterium]
MSDLWFLILALSACVILIIVWAAYYQSKALINPPNRRKPLTAFPDQYRLIHENIMFRTADGLILRGWFIPAQEESEKTIIVLHGRGQTKSDVLATTHFLRDYGFNLMYFDFRDSGESGGANLSTIEYLELRDFDAAFEFLKKNKESEARNIGVYGLSMGGAVAIYEAAHRTEIKCVVSESSFDSYRNVVARYAWLHMRTFYFPVVSLGLFFVKLRLGVDPEPFSPIYHIAKISPRPVFMVVGSHDELVPLKNSQGMFKTAKNPKELWIVPGAAHGKCAEVGGDEYKKRLSEFFLKFL